MRNLTASVCATMCTAQGMSYMAMQGGSECHCGSAPALKTRKRGDNDCSSACRGNQQMACGGRRRNAVYNISDATLVADAPCDLTLPAKPYDIGIGAPAASTLARARCVPAQLRVASSWSRSGVPRLCVDTLTGLHLSQVAVLSAFRSYSVLLLYGGLCGRIFGRVIRSFALPLRSQASATRRGCTWTTGPTASNGTPGSASTV